MLSGLQGTNGMVDGPGRGKLLKPWQRGSRTRETARGQGPDIGSKGRSVLY